ncbi:Leucine-rich repeat [Dillenia turbinata]|uniref:Leucine-rich repeat n=1 Tax=Dillenia turbinata TaxID=194707 RepID=A0AAN8VUS5_9MAGN
MALFSCFSIWTSKKKKVKARESPVAGDSNKVTRTLQVKLEHPAKFGENNEPDSTSFSVPLPFRIKEDAVCKVKVMSHESPVGDEAYEGEDEHDELPSMKRDLSDFDLQAHVANSGEEKDSSGNKGVNYYDSFDAEIDEQFEKRTERDAEEDNDMIQTGHISDPGRGKAEFWASPKLKRSCSNLETRDVLMRMSDNLPPSKSQSFEQLQELAEKVREDVFPGSPGSPGSVRTRFSADKVMLKKHSSSQVLPSRSRRLWWKLFLWSHRNTHKRRIQKPQPLPVSPVIHQQGGYSSDTLEHSRAAETLKNQSPSSLAIDSKSKGKNKVMNDEPNWEKFNGGVSGLWPQNQWVAFSAESSSLSRVDEWVKHLEMQSPEPDSDEEKCENDIVFPPSPVAGRSPGKSTTNFTRRPDATLSEEFVHANNVIQSLNSSSTVAHISGIGLKVIPGISGFSSLRSVNLSGNFIVQITPGALPKGLHTLNLSRNRISRIEGLRELTRLRELDLSYNRISRIGHGLSNCTLIKGLYLAGNKISDVEGLHRLLKLTVLDLSFNKITTAKAIGQLVANYNSLLALNLLGNPIQSNISDDQLRKAVSSLLPKLTYLNKQPIKPQRVRDVAIDSVAKAALGTGSLASRRKATRRASQGVSNSSSVRSVTIAHRSRNKSRTGKDHRLTPKIKSSPLAFTSR